MLPLEILKIQGVKVFKVPVQFYQGLGSIDLFKHRNGGIQVLFNKQQPIPFLWKFEAVHIPVQRKVPFCVPVKNY